MKSMRKSAIKTTVLTLVLAVVLAFIFSISGSLTVFGEGVSFSCEVFPLERNGIALHLDCVKMENSTPSDHILLLHGSSFSSHEFDIDYLDYSLVRRLATEGYAVWRLDIAGYGQSDPVEDGFVPDTAYAAEDINAAVEKIVQISGQNSIDVLGWSWGTMTGGRFAAEHPEHLRKLVLYAPILTGLGKQERGAAFSHNTWESAAEDFQRDEDGAFDPDITDPVLIEMFCSSCWHYDGDSSPRGWSIDAFVDEDKPLIDLERITVPTLLIYGDRDPYMNRDRLNNAPDVLPDGSEVRIIEGGSHIMMYEKPCYRNFQDSIVAFLKK